MARKGKKQYFEFYLPSVKRYYDVDVYPMGEGAVLFFHDVTLQKNSERALIVNDRNLKAILNSGSQAYFLLDAHAKVQTFNKNAAGLIQRWGASVRRKAPLTEALPEPLRTVFDQSFEKARTGAHVREELDLSLSENQPFFLRLDFHPVVETGGTTVAGVCLCIEDVTEAKRAQNELLKSERRFRSVVQNALDGIAIFDDERRIKYAGPSFLRLLGIERALGFRFSGFLPEGEKEKFDAAWNAAINDGYCRLELFTRAGRYLDVIMSHLPKEGMVFNARDVTGKKQAEERLLMLQEAVRHASDAIVVTESGSENRRGGPKILYVNPSFEFINGREASQVVGRTIGEVFDKKLAKAFDSDIGKRLNAVYVRPDGSVYEVEWAVAPLRDEHGKVIRKIAIQRDVTERNAFYRQALEKERAVLQALINGQELGRKRISEDLHDGLGSVLSVLKMSFSVLKSQLENGSELIVEALRRIEIQLDAAAEEV
ncbi:MAG: PAS domain S-box protein, partial [Bacteroidia bacterium]|nr:PAS domain S-box protein [Bacteroidia bacterium]